MHHADIYAAIVKAGSSVSGVAKDEDVSASTVTKVIRGERTSYSIATRIAVVTGLPLERLWPGKYTFPPRPVRRHDLRACAA